MSSDDREEALRFKTKGNEMFKAQRFCSAINEYTKSLNSFVDPVVLSNRAQAELKSDLFMLAQMDCTAAINLDPKAPKAYYRRAQALKALGLYELAMKDMEKCVELTNDKDMIAAKRELEGRRNVPVVELCPVERDEYLESEEGLVDIPISYDELLFDEPTNVQRVPKTQKTVPFAPRDFHDFQAAISYLNREPLLLAEYFLKIDPNSYCQLFDELLDDTAAALIFSSLLTHLQAGRPIDNLSDRLLKIGELSRFDVIMMLMSVQDQRNVTEICNYLTAEEAITVRLKYSC